MDEQVMPSDLWGDLEAIESKLDTATHVLLCLDFDGTLVPIRDDPTAVELAGSTRQTLEGIAHMEDVDLAIVSGRKLGDVRDRVGVEEATYAGNHGLEIQEGETYWIHPTVDAIRPELKEIAGDLEDALSGIPGVRVEDKGPTLTVHVRMVDSDRVPEVTEIIHRRVRDVEDVTVSSGKAVLQIRPAVDWDKGRAIERIARSIPDESVIVVVGDDRTDADGFEALEGLTQSGIAISVGNPSLPANYMVDGPEAVNQWLNWFLDRTEDDLNSGVSV